jgi:hypothetical protein
VVGLFRRNAPFLRLWTARAISFTGDLLGLIALLLDVAETTGSGVEDADRERVGGGDPADL